MFLSPPGFVSAAAPAGWRVPTSLSQGHPHADIRCFGINSPPKSTFRTTTKPGQQFQPKRKTNIIPKSPEGKEGRKNPTQCQGLGLQNCDDLCVCSVKLKPPFYLGFAFF